MTCNEYKFNVSARYRSTAVRFIRSTPQGCLGAFKIRLLAQSSTVRSLLRNVCAKFSLKAPVSRYRLAGGVKLHKLHRSLLLCSGCAYNNVSRGSSRVRTRRRPSGSRVTSRAEFKRMNQESLIIPRDVSTIHLEANAQLNKRELNN